MCIFRLLVKIEDEIYLQSVTLLSAFNMVRMQNHCDSYSLFWKLSCFVEMFYCIINKTYLKMCYHVSTLLKLLQFFNTALSVENYCNSLCSIFQSRRYDSRTTIFSPEGNFYLLAIWPPFLSYNEAHNDLNGVLHIQSFRSRHMLKITIRNFRFYFILLTVQVF